LEAASDRIPQEVHLLVRQPVAGSRNDPPGLRHGTSFQNLRCGAAQECGGGEHAGHSRSGKLKGTPAATVCVLSGCARRSMHQQVSDERHHEGEDEDGDPFEQAVATAVGAGFAAGRAALEIGVKNGLAMLATEGIQIHQGISLSSAV